MQTTHRGNRPVGITIISAVALFGSLLNVVVGSDLLGILGATPVADRGELAVPVGILLLISAALLIVAAYGLWTLKPWAWALTVALWAVALLQNVLQYANDNTLLVPMLVTAVIPAAILWYLFRPSVRAAFGRA